jgi:hypothetical protein
VAHVGHVDVFVVGMMSRQIFSLADVINDVWCDLLFRGFQGLDFGANLFNDGSLILNWNKNDQEDFQKIDLSFFNSFFLEKHLLLLTMYFKTV